GVSYQLGGIAVFKQLAQFGIDLDKSRNAMTALTGSVDKANAKLKELRDLAKVSPGVTNTFAAQLFQQLKAIGGIADQTINKGIQSLGKLSTVFADVGPEFTRNLIQIFQQGFERADIKEALGRVPIFEQLLEQAFGTKDPDKLRKLKEAGKLTLGGFLDGFSNAIDTDARFKNIQESLGGRLQKSFDETKVKLAELGEKLLQILLPALEKLIPILNVILGFLNQLPDGLKAATIGILAVAPAIGGVTNALTGLRGAVVALGGFLLSPGGIAALALLGVGVAAVGLQDLINNQIPANVRSQLGLQDRGLISPDSSKLDIPSLGLRVENGKIVQGAPGSSASASSGLDFSGLSGGAKKARAARKAKEAKTPPKDLLSAAFVKTREFDLAAAQREIESHSETLARVEIQRQKDELQAFSGISDAIHRNNEKAAKEALESAEKAQKALEKSGTLLSNNERFARGFASQIDTVGDAFERFGANVSDAFRNIGDLFGGLKRAVLSFFNDIIGGALQNLVRNTLGSLFGGGGGVGNAFRTPH